MSAGFIERAYHAALYVVGALIITAAVAVTGVRLALPDIGRHKDAVENWAGRYMGAVFAVDAISADWRGWIPRLYLDGVRLYSEDGAGQITRFDAVTLEIAPIRSLWERRIAARRLLVSGLQVAVTRLADGAVLVEGMDLAPAAADRKNALGRWLFGRNRLELLNADIRWIDHKHRQLSIQFTEVAVTIQSDSDRTQATGRAKLPEKYGERLNFALDVQGDLWSSDWSGELYAAAARLNLDNWYREYRPRALNLAGGNASLEAWSRWRNARPVWLQGILEYDDFVVRTAAGGVRVKSLKSRFMGERRGDNDWRAAVKMDELATASGAWPAADLEFAAAGPAARRRYALHFERLEPADLLPLVAAVESLPDPLRDFLSKGSLRARLEEGLVLYSPGNDEPLAYDIAFQGLAVAAPPQQPGVAELSGRLRGAGRRAALTLAGAPGRFNIPSLYPDGLAFSRMEGVLHWTRQGNGWVLRTDGLSLAAPDFSLAVRGALEKEAGRSLPYMELAAALRDGRMEKLFHYTPYAERFKIRNWMRRALHAGRVDSAVAVLRGYPDQFPFKNQDGRMRALVNISDGVVEYSPRWPEADTVDAELLFHNEQLAAVFHRGRVFNADLVNGAGRMRDLTQKHKVVELKGKVRGSARDLNLFIAQGPLAQDAMLSYAAKSMTAGRIALDLDLSVPIKTPGRRTAITGVLELNQARLSSDAGALELDQVAGAIDFAHGSAAGKDLAGRLAGQPVTLRLSGSRDAVDAPPTLVITGQADAAFIAGQITRRFPGAAHFVDRLERRLSGTTDWQARFTFENTDKGLLQRLAVSSDLHGMALDLPAPLGKPAAARNALTISKTLQRATPAVIRYAPLAAAHIAMKSDNPQELERLDLFLGELPDDPVHPGAGIRLAGRTERLDLDQWRQVLAFFGSAGQGGKPGFFSTAGVDVDLETGRLDVLGQSFEDAAVRARRDPAGWRADLDGPQLAGAVVIPATPEAVRPVTLNLRQLALNKGAGGKPGASANPGDLPPMQIQVDELRYGERPLGQVRLSALPTAAGVSFSEIEIIQPELRLSGNGSWEKSGARHATKIDAALEADAFEAVLAAFGHEATPIKDGKTSASLDLAWEGAPHEFGLDRAGGALNLDIRKGRLLDVSPAAGRLLGLLSLQTLPRRLSLDFSDLLGKGLAFDRIKGNFKLADGHAYTNDLHLSGPSADVLISGRTGLRDRDYDQLATVTPQFADNLPVASALLGPVGIGAGAVLYLAGNVFEKLNDGIDSILSYQYAITGDWDDPQIEKLKKPVPTGAQAAPPFP